MTVLTWGEMWRQNALLENSALAAAQARTTHGWMTYHVAGYKGGDPAGGFYKVFEVGPPIGHSHALILDGKSLGVSSGGNDNTEGYI